MLTPRALTEEELKRMSIAAGTGERLAPTGDEFVNRVAEQVFLEGEEIRGQGLVVEHPSEIPEQG